MDKLTASELKDISTGQETLWQYLWQFSDSMEAQILCALLIFGTLAMLGNYGLKYLRDEVSGSPIDYFFRDHFKKTVLSFLSFYASAFTLVATTTTFVNEAGVFIGWMPTIIIAIAAGANFDCYINKGDRKIWTDDDRKIKGLIAEVDDPPKEQPA